MMIVKCGHTFCESCLSKIDKCAICRMFFDVSDCQPNFYVAGDRGRQDRVRPDTLVDLDTRLGDMSKSLCLAVKSRVNKVINSWLDSIEHQIHDNPETTFFVCQVSDPSLDLLSMVKKRIEPYGLCFDLSERMVRKISENPDQMIEVRVFYRMADSKTGSVSSSAGNWITNAPFLSLLDLYSTPVIQNSSNLHN